MSSYSEDLHSAALAYHRLPRPGKLEIQAIKPLANQRDLALAYSPGVAAACTAIATDPAQAASLTIRANLVAVVSNGTAVLGLGNIGPLAPSSAWSRPWPRWSRPSAASISRISRARNVSRSRRSSRRA
jgi:malic enzyme